MFRWEIISGMCQCGHDWTDHHGNVIMNEDTIDKLPKDHPPILPGECEANGFHEFNDGHCNGYIDKDNKVSQ